MPVMRVDRSTYSRYEATTTTNTYRAEKTMYVAPEDGDIIIVEELDLETNKEDTQCRWALLNE